MEKEFDSQLSTYTQARDLLGCLTSSIKLVQTPTATTVIPTDQECLKDDIEAGSFFATRKINSMLSVAAKELSQKRSGLAIYSPAQRLSKTIANLINQTSVNTDVPNPETPGYVTNIVDASKSKDLFAEPKGLRLEPLHPKLSTSTSSSSGTLTATSTSSATESKSALESKEANASTSSDNKSHKSDAVGAAEGVVPYGSLVSINYNTNIRTFAPFHTWATRALSISSCGRFVATGSHDHWIAFWDYDTGKPFPNNGTKSHTDVIHSVQWHPVEPVLLSSSVDTVAKLWSFDKKGLSWTPERSVRVPAGIYSCAWHPDGNEFALACGAPECRTHIYSYPECKPIFELMGHTNAVMACAYSPDGRFIATTGLDGCIRVYDSNHALAYQMVPQTSAAPVVMGAFTTTPSSQPKEIWCLAWSPDSTEIAVGGPGMLQLYGIPSSDGENEKKKGDKTKKKKDGKAKDKKKANAKSIGFVPAGDGSDCEDGNAEKDDSKAGEEDDDDDDDDEEEDDDKEPSKPSGGFSTTTGSGFTFTPAVPTAPASGFNFGPTPFGAPGPSAFGGGGFGGPFGGGGFGNSVAPVPAAGFGAFNTGFGGFGPTSFGGSTTSSSSSSSVGISVHPVSMKVGQQPSLIKLAELDANQVQSSGFFTGSAWSISWSPAGDAFALSFHTVLSKLIIRVKRTSAKEAELTVAANNTKPKPQDGGILWHPNGHELLSMEGVLKIYQVISKPPAK